jgi:hypothetical protein
MLKRNFPREQIQLPVKNLSAAMLFPSLAAEQTLSIVVKVQRRNRIVLPARTFMALPSETFGESASKVLLLIDVEQLTQLAGLKMVVQTYASADFLGRRMVTAQLSDLVRDSVSLGLNSGVFIFDDENVVSLLPNTTFARIF